MLRGQAIQVWSFSWPTSENSTSRTFRFFLCQLRQHWSNAYSSRSQYLEAKREEKVFQVEKLEIGQGLVGLLRWLKDVGKNRLEECYRLIEIRVQTPRESRYEARGTITTRPKETVKCQYFIGNDYGTRVPPPQTYVFSSYPASEKCIDQSN